MSEADDAQLSAWGHMLRSGLGRWKPLTCGGDVACRRKRQEAERSTSAASAPHVYQAQRTLSVCFPPELWPSVWVLSPQETTPR